MKEIGQKLRETRLEMEISVSEAASDLKLSSSQIEELEDGNIEAFSDIFYLKYFIRDYAKYLGLDYEELVDDFNEYLFDYTSKISLDDIKNAKEKAVKEEKNLVKSPYTVEKKPHFVLKLVITIIVVIVSISLLFLLVSSIL